MTATVYRSSVAPPPEETDDSTPFVAAKETAWARLLLSAGSLLFLLLGLVGLIAGVGPMRIVGLGAYMLFGVGVAPFALNRTIGLSLRMLLASAGSLVVLILISLLMLNGGAWHPSLAFTMIIILTAPVHAICVFLAVKEIPPVSSIKWPGFSVPTMLVLGGSLLCLIAALTHRHIQPGVGGFLTQIGPIWYVGLVLLLAGLVMARSGEERTLAIGVLLLMLVVTGTPALVYDGPRGQSTAKHVDFVQQIRHHHVMNSAVTVYNNWPGMFSAAAWLCDVLGIKDPINLSMAWPALIGTTRVIAMRFLAGQVIKGKLLPWVAVVLAVLADPTGLDYFSPQSIGLVLGIAIFGVAMAQIPLWPKTVGLVLAGTALTVSHQLSPFIVGGSLCLLALFRLVRPWWMPATLLVPALAWVLMHWSDLKSFLKVGDVGSADNFKPPSTTVTSGLERMAIVGDSSLALVGGIGVLGILALVVLIRRWREPAAWALALGPTVGGVIVTVNPYGNEGIFRAMLFAIPWLALMAAQSFVKFGTKKVYLPLIGTLLVVTTTFNVAAFGLDASNVTRESDRQAILYFENSGQDVSGVMNFLLIVGPGDLPSGPPTKAWDHLIVERNVIDAQGYALDEQPQQTMTRVTGQFVRYAQDNSDGAYRLYVIWSPTNSQYGVEYGVHTAAQFAALRDSFQTSSAWKQAYERDGTVLFEYTGTVTGKGS